MATIQMVSGSSVARVEINTLKSSNALKDFVGVARCSLGLIFKAKDGRLWTASTRLGNNIYVPAGYYWAPSLLRALVKLGVIKTKDMTLYLEFEKHREAIADRAHHARQIRHHAMKLGLRLPKAFERQIDKAVKG